MPSGGTKHIRAVERAIDLLQCLARADGAVGVTELERTMGLSRPTLYRLLATLEGRGLVRSSGDPQRFALDYPVVELARAWLSRNDVVPVAQPYLDRLWRETGETVAMCLAADGLTKLCVQELQSRHALVFTRGVGFAEPLTVGASGRSILAFMAPSEIEAALAAVADGAARDRLRGDLARTRADGYCVTSGEVIAGATAMAAPVLDRLGRVRASVSVFGPDARIRDAHRDACIRRVIATAADISAAIGYRPGVAAE